MTYILYAETESGEIVPTKESTFSSEERAKLWEKETILLPNVAYAEIITTEGKFIHGVSKREFV